MNVNLRDPNTIMKLSRLGSFHQSRLSFLRSFLSEFKDWEYKRDLFDLDKNGYGIAIYSFKKKSETESIEDIEILRFFDLNEKIKMVKLNSNSVAVDEIRDVKKAEKLLKKR